MKRKKLTKFFIFLCLFILIFSYLYVSSDNIMMNTAKSYYNSVLSSASYYSIDNSLLNEYNYSDIITISKNSEGEINMLTTDSYKVNSLAKSLALYTYNYLVKETNNGVEVPLGAFTGIGLIGGFGKKINMKLIAITSVKCDMVSTFEQAGINQTRHTLYLKIKPDITIVTKFNTENKKDTIDLLIYDNLIIGSVPSVFVNSQVIGTGSN